MRIQVNVNGEPREADVEPRLLLVHFIRDTLGLIGTHWGCDTSNCGACTVHLDGEPVKSCTVLAVRANGHDVTTIEGVSSGADLSLLQQGFREARRGRGPGLRDGARGGFRGARRRAWGHALPFLLLRMHAGLRG